MADIINFKETSMSTKAVSVSEELLKDVLKDIKNIKDVMVFLKTKDGDSVIYHTELSLEDKSVFIQLLQHEIYKDLNGDTSIEFEADF
jgi:hypothetical protein